MGSKVGVKFWGARGLVSSPSLDTAKHGGNTTCMEVVGGDKVIVVDTGFGASNLGEQLMHQAIMNKKSLEVHVFYTHFHWDHTQGLPFFHPIYLPDTKLKIYSPLSPDVCKNNLNILFDGSYSPFSGIDSMPSQIEFIQLSALDEVCGFKVDFVPVDHGRDLTNQLVVPTYAYRFDHLVEKTSIGIVTDHEARPSACNNSVVEFCENVDLLIHDGQFSEDEYKLHQGWGHSSILQCLENMNRIKAGRNIITHHAPQRTDSEIRQMQNNYQKDKKFRELDFQFAEENMTYFASTAQKKSSKAS